MANISFLSKLLIISILMLSINSCFLSKKVKETYAVFSTDKGEITIKLYDDTPKHKENFIKLCNEKYYEGVLFHRVIKNFMIQTGDPDSKNAPQGKALGMGGPGYTIPAEILPSHFHKKGAIAAARLGDNVNPAKESSGSQFYIVHGQVFNKEQLIMFAQRANLNFTPEQQTIYTTTGGAPHLDGGYTVFGEVVEGLDVVDKIALVEVDNRDRPTTDIKITKVKIVEKRVKKESK